MIIVVGFVFDRLEREKMGLTDDLSTRNACLGLFDGINN